MGSAITNPDEGVDNLYISDMDNINDNSLNTILRKGSSPKPIRN